MHDAARRAIGALDLILMGICKCRCSMASAPPGRKRRSAQVEERNQEAWPAGVGAGGGVNPMRRSAVSDQLQRAGLRDMALGDLRQQGVQSVAALRREEAAERPAEQRSGFSAE